MIPTTSTHCAFTFIELSLTLAIISILIIMCYPNYQSLLHQTHQQIDTITLWKIRDTLASYHLAHNSYSGGNIHACTLPNNPHRICKVRILDADHYVITLCDAAYPKYCIRTDEKGTIFIDK